MTLDENVNMMFIMGKSMAQVRGDHPKYITKEQPRMGKPLQVFEYMPQGDDVKNGKYMPTKEITPTDIIRESDESNWYLVRDRSSQFVVHQNQNN